jgi:hypothetical protein
MSGEPSAHPRTRSTSAVGMVSARPESVISRRASPIAGVPEGSFAVHTSPGGSPRRNRNVTPRRNRRRSAVS